ncbi:MAG: hypothetical protein ACKVW3_14885 [Phycisphaerales bacterium]
MTAYRGIIENGKLVLEGGEKLPNGTEVDIRLRQPPKSNGKARKSKAPKPVDPIYRIADLAVNDDGPRDLARNLDHHLYGTPRRRAAKPRRA